MKIYLKVLKETAKNRPEGYYDDVVNSGKITGEYLEIEPPEYKRLLVKYNVKPDNVVTRKSCCGADANVTSSFPPLSEQMKNVVNAGGRIINAAIRGNQIQASSEEVTKRQQICDGCEFYNKESKRCQKCGCYLRMKIQLETEHCPIGNW